jgi:hypothetical protein
MSPVRCLSPGLVSLGSTVPLPDPSIPHNRRSVKQGITGRRTIVLLPTGRDVQKVYMSKYGRSADYVAFYSPRDNTVYVAVNDVRVGVLAHELTHVIIRHYFPQPPPAVIQEVVAQYVDSQIDD